MEHFKSILTANNYSPATIDRYVRRLRDSGVNLRNRQSVRYALSHDAKLEDNSGETYRAFLAYDRFLHNEKLPGGHVKSEHTGVTVRDACLKQKTALDVMKVWWLCYNKGYTPNTAMAYVNFSKKSIVHDNHRNVYRAMMALKDFDTNQVDVIDRHVMDYLASFRM
jgi:hypothetical protein